MSRVLFIQNGEYDHPGLFGAVLREAGVPLDIVHAWDGEPVPTVPNGWTGFVIGGGYMGAYEADQYPFLTEEVRLIEEARRAGRPVLGMCLGAQLMAAAFGGKVFPHTQKEIGFYDVNLTPAAADDPLWGGLATTIQPVHWHGDTFTLPEGAVLLGSSAVTQNQLFRLEQNLYGVQFHLEIDVPVLRAMVETDDGWLPSNGVDPGKFLSDATVAIPRIEPLARTVFNRWIDTLS